MVRPRPRAPRRRRCRGTPAAAGSRSPRSAPRQREATPDEPASPPSATTSTPASARSTSSAASGSGTPSRRSSSSLALVGIFGRGLNFGLEFRGGSEFRVPGRHATSRTSSRPADRPRQRRQRGTAPTWSSPRSAAAPSACRPRSSPPARPRPARPSWPRRSASTADIDLVLVRRAVVGVLGQRQGAATRWSSSWSWSRWCWRCTSAPGRCRWRRWSRCCTTWSSPSASTPWPGSRSRRRR